MVSFFHQHYTAFPRRQVAVVLASCWVLGLVAGAYLAVSPDDSSVSMMRAAANSCVSISGLGVSLLLPLLFSAFAVYISQIWLLIPIAFFKAFAFSYLGTSVAMLYPSGGWLLRSLLLFSDCMTAPVYLWLWFRLLSAVKKPAVRWISAVFPVLLLIGCLDFRYISPFLTNLLIH